MTPPTSPFVCIRTARAVHCVRVWHRLYFMRGYVYACRSRGFFADALRSHRYAVSGLSVVPEGLIVALHEGAALLYTAS